MKRDDSVTVERYSYTWDNMDRPLQVRHSLGYGAEVVLTDLSYDLLGRVAEDRRNGNDSLRTAYSYNIRSWQTGIESPLFTEHLYREDRREGRGSNTPRYSGGISGTDWCLSGEKSRDYDYFYDGLDRLTGASYLEEGKRADGYGTAYTYDSHGNITTLERQRLEDNGMERTNIMTMAYNGNRLCSVNGESGITWDRNGNLTSDTSAGIVSVSWNSLNLPERFETVASDGVATAEYLYGAGGRKLRVRSVGSDGDTTVTDYTGNAVWKDGSLDRLLVDGGYIEDGEYRFLITDHLGSVRGVADAESDLLFRTHYYPYGAEYGNDAGGNSVSGTGQGQNTGQDTGQGTGSDGATSEQPYRYNGKEAQSFAGVPLLDYGARLYSTRTGQWVSSDPLGEEYWSISPYAYCAGNPVDFVDPDGMAWYYNSSNGAFVAQTNEDDDRIYLLNDEQIKAVESGKESYESFKTDENMFGQMILEGTLTDVSIIGNVIGDLFGRANATEEGGNIPFVDEDISIVVNMSDYVIKNGKSDRAPYAQADPKSREIEVFPTQGSYFDGYGTMLIMAHELGHLLDYRDDKLSKNKNKREQSADTFVKSHWAYKKSSVFMRDIMETHFKQHGGKVL